MSCALWGATGSEVWSNRNVAEQQSGTVLIDETKTPYWLDPNKFQVVRSHVARCRRHDHKSKRGKHHNDANATKKSRKGQDGRMQLMKKMTTYTR